MENKNKKRECKPLKHALNRETQMTYNYRIRSKMDVKRARLMKLENLVNKYSLLFNKAAKIDSTSSSPFDEYLKWIVKMINLLNQKDVEWNNIQPTLEIELKKFEISLMTMINKFQITYKNQDIIVKRKQTRQLISQPNMSYGSFLKQGLNIYFQLFDIYSLWFTKEQILDLVYQKQASTLKFSFIALLAKFTISKKDTNYNLLYKNNLMKAKLSLKDAYLNPSHDNILALNLLLFISLFNHNTLLAHKYFSAAIRMAQSLGYDKEQSENEDKGKQDQTKLWKVLSLEYLLFVTLFPNLPALNFAIESFSLPIPTSTIKSNVKCDSIVKHPFFKWRMKLFIGSHNLDVIKIAIKIILHIQKVRANPIYLRNESKIPIDELRLSFETFNQVLSSILNLQVKYPLNPKFENLLCPNDNNTEALTFKRESINELSIQATLQFIFIFLYYPSTLVYPQPVTLSKQEIQILFRAANITTYYYLSSYNVTLGNVQIEQYRCELPYCFQSIYAIYVYFNLIDMFNCNPSFISNNIIEHSLKQCLLLLDLLKHIQLSNIKESNEAKLTLNQLFNVYTRFNLNQRLVQWFINYSLY